MLLGAHMSISGGLYQSLLRGQEVGCEVIQIFSKTSNQWKVKPLTQDDILRFKEASAETKVRPMMIHNSYLINIGSPKDADWEKSIDAFQVELERAEALGIPFVVAHPGAHLGSGEEAGLKRIAQGLDELHRRTHGFRVKILLENTAGQGTVLGYRFEQIRSILDQVREPDRLGLCFDTCHVFTAGYDIRTAEGYAATMDELDRRVGLKRVMAFHINDSMKPFESRKDRHEHIGKGMIGIDAFRCLMQDTRFSNIPMVLETPKGEEMEEDRMNLAVLRGLAKARQRGEGH
ncbi:MAG: deoxyribonuclease IV [Nitrospirae bacterium]|nr:deoxyribonuclease IV [Nitrospirota bacterium]